MKEQEKYASMLVWVIDYFKNLYTSCKYIDEIKHNTILLVLETILWCEAGLTEFILEASVLPDVFEKVNESIIKEGWEKHQFGFYFSLIM